MNIAKLLEDLRAIDVEPDVQIVADRFGHHNILMNVYCTSQVPYIERMKPRELIEKTNQMVMSLAELMRDNADKLEAFIEGERK